jgi:hypothetical protein
MKISQLLHLQLLILSYFPHFEKNKRCLMIYHLPTPLNQKEQQLQHHINIHVTHDTMPESQNSVVRRVMGTTAAIQ